MQRYDIQQQQQVTTTTVTKLQTHANVNMIGD